MQLRGTLSWTWGLRSLGQTLGKAGWIFSSLRKRQEVRGFGWVRSQLWLGESSVLTVQGAPDITGHRERKKLTRGEHGDTGSSRDLASKH